MLRLKASLEDKYKVTTDWEGDLCIGIALKWDHEKGTVNFQIQDIYAQHYSTSNTKNPRDHNIFHTPGHNPYMEKIIRCYQRKHQMYNLMKII